MIGLDLLSVFEPFDRGIDLVALEIDPCLCDECAHLLGGRLRLRGSGGLMSANGPGGLGSEEAAEGALGAGAGAASARRGAGAGAAGIVPMSSRLGEPPSRWTSTRLIDAWTTLRWGRGSAKRNDFGAAEMPG